MARSPKAVMRTIPALTGGWNARDALPAMKTIDAVVLDNWVPGPNGITLRQGYDAHATALGGAVQSLMEYSSPAGVQTLFGAAGTSVFDVTDAGAVGDPVVEDLSNTLLQHTMFATAGGNFLVFCNGADAVRNWSGATWTSPTITGSGLTSANLINVHAHVGRLWFVEKNTLKVWYLPVSSISGTATAIDLGPLCELGGHLVAMTSWTRDGGSGPDDLAVFITSKGQVLIYSGSDPASAETWQKVGTFKIAEPIGRRCFVKAGSDVGVLTSQGIVPLSTVLGLSASDATRVAATNKINGAFQSAYRSTGTLTGWGVIEYPKGALLIANVPQSDGVQSHQFVMNTLTGAWCRFVGVNALCWSMLGDAIYFGTAAGTVCRYDTGNLDAGASIRGTVIPAFSNFGFPANKRFTMARPLYTAAEGTEPPITLKVNYDTTIESLSVANIVAPGTAWDVGDWDEADWGPAEMPIALWQSVQGIGQVGSVLINVSMQTPITINNIDVMFELGGAF